MKFKSIITHALLVLTSMSLQVCAFAGHDHVANTKVFNQYHQVIDLPKQQTIFTIKLKSNKTTGYAWALMHYDRNIIKLLRNVYIAPKNTKMVGVAGYELWTFQVLSPTIHTKKITHLRFAYQRPWIKTLQTKPIDFMVVIH